VFVYKKELYLLNSKLSKALPVISVTIYTLRVLQQRKNLFASAAVKRVTTGRLTVHRRKLHLHFPPWQNYSFGTIPPPSVDHAVKQRLQGIHQRHYVPYRYDPLGRKMKPESPQQYPVEQIREPTQVKHEIYHRKFDFYGVQDFSFSRSELT
jgi:hypothetical protein